MQKKCKIKLTKTDGEWKKIEAVIPSGDVHRFLNNEIQKLVKRYEENPATLPVRNKKAKFHYPNPQVYKKLVSISSKTNTPVSKIIDDHIIQPLLQKH